jgi:hypothetical protein
MKQFGSTGMSNSTSKTSKPGQTAREDRWGVFLAVAAVAHGVALFGCPSIAVPPRISTQLTTVGVAAAVCIIPFVTSLALLLRYRTLSQRVIAFCSLAASLLWLALAGGFIELALKGP